MKKPNEQEPRPPIINRDFVVWRCPVCGAGRSGWPDNPHYRRNCMNWAPRGGRCGAIMQIFETAPAERAA